VVAGGGEMSPLAFEAMGSGGGGRLIVVVVLTFVVLIVVILTDLALIVVVVCRTGRACLHCPVVIALIEPKNQIKTLVS
jgi:hypothetical protein